ncbi:MAG TPA: pyroglutamyl-peptidase I [Methyloceanibacter sp.]|nr:pyroglutamyl-peptidase I [Methyloceanibacter sp.]
MAQPRVLITGFGPFPGVAENPSFWLAETLARQERPPGISLDARILPTMWEDVALIPRLYRSLQPHAMIHFGVSERAKAFHIEASAHNRVTRRADARGAMPKARSIREGGPARFDTPFPAAGLAAHLRRSGIAARTSRSAGAYLCNFLYYHSLEWAHRQRTVPLVVFVHIPPWTRKRGSQSREALLLGGTEILRFVLACANGAKPLKTKGRQAISQEADLSARGA